jgi:hypothetical protein
MGVAELTAGGALLIVWPLAVLVVLFVVLTTRK